MSRRSDADVGTAAQPKAIEAVKSPDLVTSCSELAVQRSSSSVKSRLTRGGGSCRPSGREEIHSASGGLLSAFPIETHVVGGASKRAGVCGSGRGRLWTRRVSVQSGFGRSTGGHGGRPFGIQSVRTKSLAGPPGGEA